MSESDESISPGGKNGVYSPQNYLRINTDIRSCHNTLLHITANQVEHITGK